MIPTKYFSYAERIADLGLAEPGIALDCHRTSVLSWVNIDGGKRV